MPGKSTILRTGRMMSASSGSATVPSVADRDAAALAFSPGGAIGDFQPANDGSMRVHRKSAFAADDDAPGFEGDLEFARGAPWERDAERESVDRLVEVDRWLPARRFSRADLEEPAL